MVNTKIRLIIFYAAKDGEALYSQQEQDPVPPRQAVPLGTNLQDLLELIPKKDVIFIIRDWNAKVGSQETPGVTGKFAFGVQNEARQRLIKFCQENAPVIANTFFQQHKRRLYTWTSPDGHH